MVGLNILVFGASNDAEILRSWLSNQPGVADVNEVPDTQQLWAEIRTREVSAVVVDLNSTDGGPESAALTIFRIREEFPEILFALMGSDEELARLFGELPAAVGTRLSHYRRVGRNSSPEDAAALVSTFMTLQTNMSVPVIQRSRFKYDVALSFAGEDRHHADAIAKLLKAQGVRVFFDTFEQAELWGANLFDKLDEVYSEQSRYTMIFVSRAYAEKMWTNHERQSAQERSLRERGGEYLLPVRVEPVDLPGLRSTIAYLDISIGYEQIATLFIRKLSGVLGSKA